MSFFRFNILFLYWSVLNYNIFSQVVVNIACNNKPTYSKQSFATIDVYKSLSLEQFMALKNRLIDAKPF